MKIFIVLFLGVVFVAAWPQEDLLIGKSCSASKKSETIGHRSSLPLIMLLDHTQSYFSIGFS